MEATINRSQKLQDAAELARFDANEALRRLDQLQDLANRARLNERRSELRRLNEERN